jgi:transposase
VTFSPRTRRGSRAPNASLSPEQVVRIRELTEHDWTAKQIKQVLELTCSERTVRRVMNQESYRETSD